MKERRLAEMGRALVIALALTSLQPSAASAQIFLASRRSLRRRSRRRRCPESATSCPAAGPEGMP
jgi:hypothetical protein